MPCMEHMPGSTTDTEHEPAAMPAPERTPEPIIILEPESNGMSDQMHELATLPVPVGVLMAYEGRGGTLSLLRVSCAWPLYYLMRK